MNSTIFALVILASAFLQAQNDAQITTQNTKTQKPEISALREYIEVQSLHELILGYLESDWRELQTLTGHTKAVNSVVISQDNNCIVSGSTDSTIKIWTKKDGKFMESPAQTLSPTQTNKWHTSGVSSVAFSPDSKTIVSGSCDDTIKIWTNKDGQFMEAPTQTPTRYTDCVSSVAVAPDNSFIVSGSDDGTIKIWIKNKNGTFECAQTITGHTDRVTSVALSSDNNCIVSGSYDGTIKIWINNKNGTFECAQTLADHTRSVYSVALSQDNSFIVSGSGDNTTRVWRIANNQATAMEPITCHRHHVKSVIFSADSNYIFSASDDGTIKMGQLIDGTYHVVETLSTDMNWVYSLSLSSDNHYLVAALHDGIKVWENPFYKSIKTTSNNKKS